ncbi:hypothetical protein Hanom_Chr15g01365061 [Helianthus anomalus]
MAEIVTSDDVEVKVDVEVEKDSEAEEVNAEQTTEVQEENLKSDDEKDATNKKMAADFADFIADLNKSTGEVNYNPTSSVCLRCLELHGEVDRLSTQNQSLINEMSSIKESNFFVKRNETLYLKKIKGYENEIDVLTFKLNEKLQIIDLAHDTTSEKTKEVSEKCKELSKAQLKIVELEKKLNQFRDSTFVMKHMMSGLKKSNDKISLGFQGFNGVPPPLSHDYSFLPDEYELTDFVLTAPSSSTLEQCDVSEYDDVSAKKENNREPILKQKVHFPKIKSKLLLKR